MKILAHILLASFTTCPLLGFAQQVPLFQFTMHFEDSIGNRDSVVLGADPDASTFGIDTQFGEVVITDPFDSIFEVRVIHFDDFDEKFLKILIVDDDTSFNCAIDIPAKIVINTKYPPVKITYDSTIFPINSCGNLILSRNWDMFFIPEWWDACGYHCMAGSSGYVEHFGPPQPEPLCWNFYSTKKEVEGQGLKSLHGLLFTTFYGPGPCNDPTFLAAKDVRDIGFGTLNPNPVREHFIIKVPSEGGMQAVISDVAGRVVACPFTVSEASAEFDVGHLSPGLYFVALQTEIRSQAVYKFIKI